MNKGMEKIYYKIPYQIQNLFISLYGIYLHQMRYGGRSDKYTEELLVSQWFSKEELIHLQREGLTRLISHAYNNVPYYNELFKTTGLSPKDIQDIFDLKKIPFLTKNTIKNSFDKLISRGPIRKKLARFHTSGTTGSPLTIICDIDDRRRHYAFLNRLRSWYGVEMGLRRASFYGRIIVPQNRNRPPFWCYDVAENNYIFSSYHMTDKNLCYYYDKLLKIRPVEISGYPSSLFIVARYILANKLPPIKPRFIMTTAETLLAQQRSIIEAAFQCAVSDQYGCTEMALFVSQCEKGNYHIHPEYGIVEVLDKKGEPVHSGEEGEVVCTSFINQAMPLIRYQLGDIVKTSSSSCPCGRNFPVIEHIVGRSDDILITPDGKPLGRLDTIFKNLEGIYETQIIQTAADCLELKIVTGRNFSDKHINELMYEIRKRVGIEMTVKVDKVDEIPKDRNGKFKSVLSRINKP